MMSIQKRRRRLQRVQGRDNCSYGRPRLVRREVAVIAVRTHMVIGDVGKLLHRLIR